MASAPPNSRTFEVAPPGAGAVGAQVATALAEDMGDGDRTAELIPAAQSLSTRVVCRDEAVLCGQDWFEETYRQLDSGVNVDWAVKDGDALAPGDEVCRVRGPARPVLSGERTALNFLQTLSATATRTAQYVRAVAGTGATILDTRKTIPGLRTAQKYAVRCGGGANHRMGLFDAVLIKENHIAAAGSIGAAVARARKNSPGLMLEVEVETMSQLDEAVEAGAGRALLDNFPLERLREAVSVCSGTIELEASGGISLETVRAVAETGVDFISTGDVTKNVRAVDYSMRFLKS